MGNYVVMRYIMSYYRYCFNLLLCIDVENSAETLMQRSEERIIFFR